MWSRPARQLVPYWEPRSVAEFSLKQLDAVEDEARNLRDHSISLDDALSDSEELMEFATEAFNQFFRARLSVGVTGFSQSDKEEVLQAASFYRGTDEPIYELAQLYVDFCNTWPDVLDPAYGGSPADFREFRAELVPSLLDTLLTVSTKDTDPKVTAAIEQARTAYRDAVEEARRAERTKR